MSAIEPVLDPTLAPVQDALAAYVTQRRWFRSKTRAVTRCAIAEAIPLPLGEGSRQGERAWLAVVEVTYESGPSEDYALPILLVGPERAAEATIAGSHLFIAHTPEGAPETGAYLDALGEPRVLQAILRHVARGTTVNHDGSVLRFRRTSDEEIRTDAAPHLVTAEQSNTSVVFGEAFILKVIRKLDEGVSADLEMGEFLTGAGYAHAPAVAGAIDLSRGKREPATVAILHRFVPNRGDAWSFFLERLGRTLDTNDASSADDVALLRTLARRIGQMHLALASRPDLPSFAPEPLTRGERAHLADAVRASMRDAVVMLTANAPILAADAARAAGAVRLHQADFEASLTLFVEHGTGAQKSRVHGDLHLGQVLVNGDDFVLIDFEGEPARSLAERKSKRSPLVDVAGMLRSLHYASVSASRAHAGDPALATQRTEAWYRDGAAAFLEAWLKTVNGAPFLPRSEEGVRRTLDFHLLEKCVYELHYEMNNRPDWAYIPLAGLSLLLKGSDAP